MMAAPSTTYSTLYYVQTHWVGVTEGHPGHQCRGAGTGGYNDKGLSRLWEQGGHISDLLGLAIGVSEAAPCPLLLSDVVT